MFTGKGVQRQSYEHAGGSGLADFISYSAPRHRCCFDLLFKKEHSVETI